MKRKLYLIYIMIFVALLFVCLVSMLLGYEALNKENRPLARFPQIASVGIAQFPASFDRWFEDHFGLREEMVSAFNALTIKLFGDTLNEKVIVGDDMLFYAETLGDYTGTSLLSDDDIIRAATVLRLQSEYAKTIDAGFFFAIAPNKNTVYPELMPGLYSRINAKSNRERLYAELDAQNVSTLDLAGLLISRKNEGELYHAEDTHWNDRGALIAYEAIMRSIAPSAAREDYTGRTPAIKHDYAGDLHNFVLPSRAGKNERPDYGIETVFEYDKGARPAQDIAFGTSSGKNDARLYMFRDSFALALIPYISANTGRAVYSSEFPYNYLKVAGEEPDAILIELVERNIKNLLTSAPLMPAIETRMPSLAVKAPASIQSRSRNGHTQIFGCFEGKGFDASSKIYVVSDSGRAYEAFPVLDEDAETGGFSLPYGFCVTLVGESAQGYSVWVG